MVLEPAYLEWYVKMCGMQKTLANSKIISRATLRGIMRRSLQ
jgi:hypothetical protein